MNTTAERLRRAAKMTVPERARHFPQYPCGLSMEDARRKRRTIPPPKRPPFFRPILFRAGAAPFSLLLLFLSLSAFLLACLYPDSAPFQVETAVSLLFMTVLSILLRLGDAVHREKAFLAAESAFSAAVSVRRSGKVLSLSPSDLAAGDVVLLSPGQSVAADLLLMKTEDLYLSQARLTGESMPVRKESASSGEGFPLHDAPCLALFPSVVASGRGEGIVIAAGSERLHEEIRSAPRKDAPAFSHGASSITFVFLRFMAVLLPAAFLLAFWAGKSPAEAFFLSLAAAVGLTPEMLPLVIAACLICGSRRLARSGMLLRNPDIMQALGSADIICFDKTGTLTKDDVLLEYYTDILGNESPLVLDLAYLNSAHHSRPSNPVDAAILRVRDMADRSHFRRLLKTYKKLDELPFDQRFLASVLVTAPEGNRLIAKGAPREILRRCRFVWWGGQAVPIGDDGEGSLSAVMGDMAEDGLKVIAVAVKDMGSATTLSPSDESGMTLMGFIAFFDAPRPSAAAAISSLKMLGLRPKILSGDSAASVLSVARRTGISAGRLLTGREIRRLSDKALHDAAEKTDLFAELLPDQKERILTALKARGHTTLFLGDGMNDLPALLAADGAIAAQGSPPAVGHAAGALLLHKDLTLLSAALREGRRTTVNMKKYIFITGSSNFGNILSALAAGLFLPFPPMTVLQFLLLNVLYDFLCLVIPWDSADEEDLARPVSWNGGGLFRFMTTFGPVSSIFDMVTFLFLYFFLCPAMAGGSYYTLSPAEQLHWAALFQTGWFLESLWTQLFILHVLRSRKSLLTSPLPLRLITLGGILLCTMAAMTAPPLFPAMASPPASYLLYLAAMALLYIAAASRLKSRVLRLRGRLY